MKIQELLDHHGIHRNPFAEEDAQTDHIFKEACIDGTYHPAWDKVYGDPSEPATAVVFGEKGAGKTAMRLQIACHVEEYNRQNQKNRLFVIHYDDFNPFLDRFRLKSRRRQSVDRVLKEWRLWDHMDAILSLGVTGIVDQIVGAKRPSEHTPCPIDRSLIARLDRHQSRDLLLLAACYDQSTAETVLGRWQRLRRALNFRCWAAYGPMIFGILISVAVVALLITFAVWGKWTWFGPFWIYLVLLFAGWTPWLWRFRKFFFLARTVVRRVRVANLDKSVLRKILLNFTGNELATQPLPNKDRTDDRYEMLAKFQGILSTLGHSGVIVLVDRLDEPHLINGSVELMRTLLWPMLDNKFLKQSGIGLKLMLPVELVSYIDREQQDFFQRARLDKQNLIRSLEWSGEALYDIANARIRGCAAEGAEPSLQDLFEDSVDEQRLVDSLRMLRVPRHLFKFLYRLLTSHCSAHTDDRPEWKISRDTFESVLAVFVRDQDAWDRGLSAG